MWIMDYILAIDNTKRRLCMALASAVFSFSSAKALSWCFFFCLLLVLLVFTCSAYAQAGPSNCTKKAGTSGCRKKNKNKRGGGGDITTGRTNRSHSGFRSFTEIHRNIPSLREFFYSHQGGRLTSTSPRFTKFHKQKASQLQESCQLQPHSECE